MHMHKVNEYLKVMMVAGLIAFASTVSALHVHPLTVCESQCHYSVESEINAHDCVFCWVVYQTLTVESASSATLVTVVEQDYGRLHTSALSSVTHIYHGRAPPFTA
jgi:hypothetical protein